MTVCEPKSRWSIVGNTWATDLVFVDDTVFFVESLKVLVMVLDALREEA